MTPPDSSITSPAIRIEFTSSLPSTQQALRERSLSAWPPDGATLLVAAEQTGGVGRFGRAWSSPRGGLWCTLALPGPDARSADGLGLRVGVACAEFVRSLVPESDRARVGLKWPNDVLIDGRKVLGVLCELLVRERRVPGAESSAASHDGGGPPDVPTVLLIGVGLNANFPDGALPESIRGSATTLLTATGQTINLARAAADLANALVVAAKRPGLDRATIIRARELLSGVGSIARFTLPDGQSMAAALVGLDRDGNPVVESDGSRWTLPSSVEFTRA